MQHAPQQPVIEDYLKLADKTTWFYYRKVKYYVDLEELQSLALLGLAEAWAKRHDPRITHFESFAYSCMHNTIKGYLRSAARRKDVWNRMPEDPKTKYNPTQLTELLIDEYLRQRSKPKAKRGKSRRQEASQNDFRSYAGLKY